MDIAIEISLYPLRDQYVPAITDLIGRINAHADIKVVTNSMSTQISGEYMRLMQVLTTEIGKTFQAAGKSVFVMKILGPFDSA